MKRLVFISGFLVVLAFVFAAGKKPLQSPELKWYTSLDEAHQLSQKNNKPIFAFFTGSDWCGWCMKLQRDVFAKEAFKKWANEHVILLELDYPKKKKLPDNLRIQNQNLAKAFNIQGYPKVWLFRTEKDSAKNNLNINAYGSLGYPVGAEAGKEEVSFLNTANAILGIK